MFKAVRLTDDDRLLILDQTLLPQTVAERELTDCQSLIEAIRSLRVRGAPAIGIAAAYGTYILAKTDADPARLLAQIEQIEQARPTAVNLSWALRRMRQVIESTDATALLPALRAEAVAIDREDAAISQAIAESGFSLLRDGMGVLTHCNAGALATSELGTALAPLYLALQRGLRFTVYCDETRPLLQGARLTAWEMQQAGADTVLLCDNMAASLMAAGRIDCIFVGADRIAANGDTANKIGTLGLAVLAQHFRIPFYVCAPSSTLDPQTADGSGIVIEQRAPEEVCELWYRQRMAPQQIAVYNPAFDVTPADLISAIITEQGILRPPFRFAAVR